MSRRYGKFNRYCTPAARLNSAKLFDTLLAIHGSCKRITSKDMCIISHYAVMSGVPGSSFKQLALPPGLPSGRYSKHIKRRMPRGGPYYRADIPIFSKSDPTQKSRSVVFKSVMHTIANEVNATPGLRDMLRRGDVTNPDSVMSLPAYASNPMTIRSLAETGSFPLPL
eukprot:8004206-Pyramimonas_sp.AAC.1